MLSDGGISFEGFSAKFSMSLADNKKHIQRETIPVEKLLEFLQHLTTVFSTLGIIPNTGYPKIILNSTKSKDGKLLPGCVLSTMVSSFCKEQYTKWYRNGMEYKMDKYSSGTYSRGEKVLPKDFKLTPISLAYLFMLDGTSVWKNRTSIDVCLSTYSFNLLDILSIESQLHSKFNLVTGRAIFKPRSERTSKTNSNIGITIHQESIDSFMTVVKPYVIDPYLYKVKYRGSCPVNILESIKTRKGIRNIVKGGS